MLDVTRIKERSCGADTTIKSNTVCHTHSTSSACAWRAHILSVTHVYNTRVLVLAIVVLTINSTYSNSELLGIAVVATSTINSTSTSTSVLI